MGWGVHVFTEVLILAVVEQHQFIGAESILIVKEWAVLVSLVFITHLLTLADESLREADTYLLAVLLGIRYSVLETLILEAFHAINLIRLHHLQLFLR